MRSMRRSLTARTALGIALALFLGGCGATSDATPVACLDGPGAYLGALGDAPGEVKLSGEVPISACLAENQQGGDLATVGRSMVEAATRLNTEARAEPGGEATVELGYLLGAATRGGEETHGIHADLVRRLLSASRYGPSDQPIPPAYVRAYREGFAAGSKRG
jgi:hypothetical protein